MKNFARLLLRLTIGGLFIAGPVMGHAQRIQVIAILGFEPAGFLVDLVGVLVAIFGLALGGYLLYVQFRL